MGRKLHWTHGSHGDHRRDGDGRSAGARLINRRGVRSTRYQRSQKNSRWNCLSGRIEKPSIGSSAANAQLKPRLSHTQPARRADFAVVTLSCSRPHASPRAAPRPGAQFRHLIAPGHPAPGHSCTAQYSQWRGQFTAPVADGIVHSSGDGDSSQLRRRGQLTAPAGWDKSGTRERTDDTRGPWNTWGSSDLQRHQTIEETGLAATPVSWIALHNTTQIFRIVL